MGFFMGKTGIIKSFDSTDGRRFHRYFSSAQSMESAGDILRLHRWKKISAIFFICKISRNLRETPLCHSERSEESLS